MVDAPQLFDLFGETMKIQRRIDPNAGYGALQIPMHCEEHGLTIAECEAIAACVKNNTAWFYLHIRGLSHSLYSKDTLIQRCADNQPYPRRWIINEIQKRDPQFYTEVT